jgi:hypothetical protein
MGNGEKMALTRLALGGGMPALKGRSTSIWKLKIEN